MGTLVALGVVFFLFLVFLLALGSAGGTTEVISSNSVLELNFSYAVPEQSKFGLPQNINPLAFEFNNEIGLNEIRRVIRKAKGDKKIEGILLDLESNPNSFSVLSVIREELEDFKSEGKFVVGYGQFMSQRALYLGSVADEVYLHPTGYLDLKGFNAELSFYKNALDKLGVQMQVFYDGKFKSATEPYRLAQMSDENRLQLREFLDEAWDQYKETVAEGRGISKQELQRAADQLDGLQPQLVLNSGLVDALLHEDELQDLLCEKLRIDTDSDINYVSLKSYKDNLPSDKLSKKQKDNKVAVIYAEGTIVDGSADGGIGGDDLSALLRKARKDDDIKAVVLRVNSPGGSAPASDVIWREASLLAEKKTLVVSMGSLAASGGYYISAPADHVYAQANTLTGSIGVFMMLPNTQGLMNDKLGITHDTVKTGALADFPSMVRPVSKPQRVVLQAAVDSTYYDFLDIVAEGRDMPRAAVEEVAQGRIWMGTQALQNGLVDELGGLDDAVDKAVELASLGESYGVVEWPVQEPDPLDELIGSFMATAQARQLETELGPYYEHLKLLQEVTEIKGIQARMPYNLNY